MATALAGAGKCTADDALSALSQRAARLRQVSDPVERDRLCTPLAAYARALDRSLAPEARVFVSGILGKENGTRIGVYYFLRNYLFPRMVVVWGRARRFPRTAARGWFRCAGALRTRW
jgi:hypothetical protein